jgi:formiminotetrahydrofolate cyclodeaminase
MRIIALALGISQAVLSAAELAQIITGHSPNRFGMALWVAGTAGYALCWMAACITLSRSFKTNEKLIKTSMDILKLNDEITGKMVDGIIRDME